MIKIEGGSRRTDVQLSWLDEQGMRQVVKLDGCAAGVVSLTTEAVEGPGKHGVFNQIWGQELPAVMCLVTLLRRFAQAHGPQSVQASAITALHTWDVPDEVLRARGEVLGL